MTRAALLIVILSMCLSLFGCGNNIDTPNKATNAAVSPTTVYSSPKNFNILFAQYKYMNWCEIGSDGSYMTIDTDPKNSDDSKVQREALAAIEIINAELGFSGALLEKMKNTRGLDGTLTESNKYYTVTWRASAAIGLEIIYEINN